MFVFVPLVGRLTSFDHPGVLMVSGVIGILPQSLEASAHLWAEPLVTLAFIGTLGASLRFLDAPGPTTVVAVVRWSVLGAASHGRLLPLAVLAAVFVVVYCLLRRSLGLAIFGASAAGLALGGLTVAHRWIVSRVWEVAGSGNSEATVLRRLTKPLEVLDAAVGQTWYQLAASGLMVAFGVIELARRARLRTDARQRKDAWVVVFLTLPVVGLSFVFMSDVGRADHVLYGRYIDAVIWPVLAVGANWVTHVRPRMALRTRWFILTATIVLFVELAFVVHQLHRHQLRVPGVNAMIAGIVPLSDWGSINALVVTAFSLAITALLFRSLTSIDRRLWTGVVVAVVCTMGIRLWAIQRPDANRPAYGEEARAILELADGPPPGSEIGVLLMPDALDPVISRFTQRVAVWSYQLYLPEYRFSLDNGLDNDVGPYVFAVDNDRLLTLEGGKRVWEHSTMAMALWKEPSGADSKLTADG